MMSCTPRHGILGGHGPIHRGDAGAPDGAAGVPLFCPALATEPPHEGVQLLIGQVAQISLGAPDLEDIFLAPAGVMSSLEELRRGLPAGAAGAHVAQRGGFAQRDGLF